MPTLTREEILAVSAAGPEAVVAVVESLLAHIARQEEQIGALTARVTALEARLAKDSHNSSKPPASDGLTKRTKSLRAPTGKKPGGQPGHPGATLRLADRPDALIVHAPPTCRGCGASLAGVPACRQERRQLHELPPLQLVVSEHQTFAKVCPRCLTLTAAAFPAGLSQPVQYGPAARRLRSSFRDTKFFPFPVPTNFLPILFAASSPK